MGSGMTLDQMRAFVKSGRWQANISCWPDDGRWILTAAPHGDRRNPYHFLAAEKSGLPRRMTAETALKVAWLLADSDVYFSRLPYQPISGLMRKEPEEKASKLVWDTYHA